VAKNDVPRRTGIWSNDKVALAEIADQYVSRTSREALNKLQLQHSEHVLHLGSYRRLGSVLRPLDFVEVISMPIAAMGAVLRSRRTLVDDIRLPTIRLIAPHPRLLSMQQVGQ